MRSSILLPRLLIGALIASAAALISAPASGQAYLPGKAVSDINPQPTKLLCWDGSAYAACTFSGGGGGGGTAGTEYTEDAASAANPIGPMTLCRRRDTPSSSEVSADGDNIVTNCTAKGEIRVRDSDLITALGSPFQAGASIGNTSFGISGTLPAFASTPTFNLGTLNGAATAAKQPAFGTASSPSSDVITVAVVPSASTSTGVSPSTAAGAATLSVKTSAGAVYGVNAVNSTTAGYLVIYNASSMPSASASLTAGSILYCLGVAPGNSVSDHFNPPLLATSGVMAMFSTSCTTRTDVSPAPVLVSVAFK